ncbi:MAG TPA: flagellar hook-associated protein FlgL [Acidobacteriaceae bacterium]|jgi:flagellar hook-associated protein 3 FlgL|nr:flagellar hook-associated protein FlgL [Acidobacteriaceae bacterium]
MQVNPDYMTNLVASLDATSSTEETLTEELASGSRVNQLSDDPVAAGENVMLRNQIGNDDSFSQTASTTQSMLQVSDSALGTVVSQLTSAISLATEANNGTLDASDVESISNQLAGIRDEVVAMANTTYLGRYVFSGSQGGTEPYTLDTTVSPAVATYQGDGDVEYLQTPNGQQIQLNVPGSQIFSAAGTNVLGTLNQLVADYSTGTPSATAIADTGALSTALGYVTQQRVLIDNSITRLTAAQNYTQSEQTQLESAQTTLLQADVGQIATQLSTAETQQTALSQVISTIGKQTLFDDL